ncbi:hypothetical protein PAHAL_4G249200 [Panicum hallii]|uniref:Uncharacterized protein n=1 Tax=Panicum hallii TaxID=206008 RepID=A0A2T8JDU5_9POAL|nr:hypothetical protein PAHAL_4G249200 [Panicum hallii]
MKQNRRASIARANSKVNPLVIAFRTLANMLLCFSITVLSTCPVLILKPIYVL